MDTFNYYEIFLLIFDIITTFSFTWYFYWKAFYMQHHASLSRAYTISTGSISMLLRGGHCSISYTFSISLGYHSFFCIFFSFSFCYFSQVCLCFPPSPSRPLSSSPSFPSLFHMCFRPPRLSGTVSTHHVLDKNLATYLQCEVQYWTSSKLWQHSMNIVLFNFVTSLIFYPLFFWLGGFVISAL